MKAAASKSIPDRTIGIGAEAGLEERSFLRWQGSMPALLWAYEGRVDAAMRHSLEVRTRRMTAWLITRGRVRLVSDNKIRMVRRGEWVFFCGRLQKHDFSPAASLISVSLRVPLPGEEAWWHEPFVLEAERHPELERAARKLVGLVAERVPEARSGLSGHVVSFADAARIGARALEWSAVYMEAWRGSGAAGEKPRKGGSGREARRHPKVAQALERLLEAPAHERYSDARLAKEVGVSTGHLERLFVHELGLTPRGLREQHRRREAGHRVRHGDASLKQIALELGFGSASHFSNWFRRVFGQSPREWRKGSPPLPRDCRVSDG